MRRLATWLLIACAISGATSCAYNNPLTISSATPSVVVFYGTVFDNDGDEVTGPGFIYGPITLKWNGDKDLKLISINIIIPAAAKLSGEFNCNFDSETLQDAFPTSTDMVLRKGVTYTATGNFVCTGISALNKNDTFIASGLTKTRGFTGGTTDQKFYKADTKIFFYYFPENDD